MTERVRGIKEERRGMTAFELKNELCGNISEEEWAALEAGKGLYINDYSPKFSESYNVYDKAREHMKKLHKEAGE